MNRVIPQELQELARLFPDQQQLFLVGGFVRDYLINVENNESWDYDNADIDLASSITPQELKSLLENTPFECKEASARLGTMIIKGARSYEYTTFRQDSYPINCGLHTPCSVEFCKEIEVDATRRDFRCNAIYWDIKNNQIIDPLNGREDIKKKILATTRQADKVFEEDGLRIMRLFRFVSQLGFSIEKHSLQSAEKYATRLKDISVERIAVELKKLLMGSHCYQALCQMRDSGIMVIILPDLQSNNGIAQPIQYHKYDVLEHIFQTVKFCPCNVRLAGLFHDIAKAKCLRENGNFYMHADIGAKMVGQILSYYKFSNKEIEHTQRLVKAHMFNLNGDAKTNTIRKFVAQNFDIIEDIVALMYADSQGSGKELSLDHIVVIEKTYQWFEENNIPINARGLAVDGNDLIKMGVVKNNIGKIMQNLVDDCICGTIINTKEALIDRIEKVYIKK